MDEEDRVEDVRACVEDEQGGDSDHFGTVALITLRGEIRCTKTTAKRSMSA